MTYWQYLKRNHIWVLFLVSAIMVAIWFTGLTSGIDSGIEAKFLALIIGIPSAVVFIGNYIKWKQL